MAVVVSKQFTFSKMIVCASSNCLAVNPTEEGKVFIQIVLEKENDTCIVTGPFQAIPRVLHIKIRTWTAITQKVVS